MTNLDLFRLYTGTTFALLYEAFPMRRRLDAAELVEHCKLTDNAISREKHLRLVEETWRWLVETGYLRHDIETGYYDLTPQSFGGLTFLDDAEAGVCRGDKLRQLTKTVGSETAIETIAGIVSLILGAGARSAYSMLA